MEAAFVCGVLKVVGNKLIALIASDFASIMSVRKDLDELQGPLNVITSCLRKVQDRGIENDPPFGWVPKLKNVSYDIEHLLDQVNLEAEKHKIDSDGDNMAITTCFCAKPILFQLKMAYKIKEVKVRLSAILKQISDIYPVQNSILVDPPIRTRNILGGELSLIGNVDKLNIPVRDQEKDDIIFKLIEPDGENGSIVSIVGIGGSGKTTLAKLICLDKLIKQNFNNSIFWVYVSREFDMEKLICKLFESIVGKKADYHTQQNMVKAISNKLCGKKFLLVLDDVWHRDRLDWEQFMAHLQSGAPGSRILLTTRDQKVAEAMGSRHIRNLAFLSEAESWILFLKSSGWAVEELDPVFIRVGRKIVKKCGGVPLAIKIIGGVLHEMRDIDALRAIKDSSLWNGQNINDRTFASLRLSYSYLADHLKPCFTFCSIFPKGYGINKDHLIAQWIAHGFIISLNGDHLEGIGSDYFDSLVKVGFFQDPCQSRHTKQLSYRMHDLIHDLTRQILQDEMVTSLPKEVPRNYAYKCRYISLKSCSEKIDGKLFGKARALYISGGNPSLTKPVRKNCHVRSAILQYSSVDAPFPLFVLKFRYLGYLKISNLKCTKLPEAISGCWNLQTLLLINCRGFVTLPESIGKLAKLRTLELLQGTDLESLPQSIGDCRNLQYLLIYLCQKLRELPNSISKIGNLRVLHVVKCPSLQQQSPELNGRELTSLQTLNFTGCRSIRDLPTTFKCRTLRTLDLSHTNIAVLPEWITLIVNLEYMDLCWCKELVELPARIVDLRRLEVLCITGCHKLCRLPSGFGQLTRLRTLGLFVVGCGENDARISELRDLEKISGRLEITNLKYLRYPGDAEKSCLKKKKNVEVLMLNWSQNQDFVSDMDHDLDVLDDLEPPSETRELIIRGYRGPRLPRWMMNENGSLCSESEGPQFLCLTILQLQQLPKLKHMRGLVELPSLKKLRLFRMPNLEELWVTTCRTKFGEEKEGAHCCFPVLCTLIIVDCPKLIVKPFFPSSLERLSLKNSNELLLSSPSNSPCSHLLHHPHALEPSTSRSATAELPHLKDLRLEGMVASSSGWALLRHLTGLESLEIHNCNDLKRLPESIRSLTSLRRLHARKCSALGMLPEWLGELCSLQQLLVLETPLVASLPQSMEHTTCLQRLHIGGWNNLNQLPEVIQHLTSLHTLKLEGCSAIAVLPEWIGELSALRRLLISGCPDLVARYRREDEEEWRLLSRISYVEILA